MKFKALSLLISLFAWVSSAVSSPALAQPVTQCVTNAQAGGTSDALTVPLLPCGLATNLLVLTLAATNVTTSPTLQMAGFPALPILLANGEAPGVAALPAAGSVALLAGTGSSWLLVGGASSGGQNSGSGNTASGNIQFTNGTIIEWGKLESPSGGTGTVTLPLAFPNAYTITTNVSESSGNPTIANAATTSLSSFTLYAWELIMGTWTLTQGLGVGWIAVGY